MRLLPPVLNLPEPVIKCVGMKALGGLAGIRRVERLICATLCGFSAHQPIRFLLYADLKAGWGSPNWYPHQNGE